MRGSPARTALLVIVAMSAGLALGMVTKFGLGYDLSARADQVAGGAPRGFGERLDLQALPETRRTNGVILDPGSERTGPATKVTYEFPLLDQNLVIDLGGWR